LKLLPPGLYPFFPGPGGLHEGTDIKQVRVVDLRRRPSGKPIAVKDGSFKVRLPDPAPCDGGLTDYS
jgi:hypothetical protein